MQNRVNEPRNIRIIEAANKFEKHIKGYKYQNINNVLIMYLNNYNDGGWAGGGILDGFGKKSYCTFFQAINEGDKNFGFYYIWTYHEFCELVNELRLRGFIEITYPPSHDDYNSAVQIARNTNIKYGYPEIIPKMFQEKNDYDKIVINEYIPVFFVKPR